MIRSYPRFARTGFVPSRPVLVIAVGSALVRRLAAIGRAILRVIAGKPELALEHIDRSIRLSPRDHVGVHTSIIGLAHFLTCHFELAAQNFRLTVRRVPGWPASYRFLAACYAHLQRGDEAYAAIEQLRAIGADPMPCLPFPNRKMHELLISGLRLATGEA